MTETTTTLLQAVEREVESAAVMTAANGVSAVRAAIRALVSHEQKLILALEDAKSRDPASPWISDAERVLERTVSQIARLIDLASISTSQSSVSSGGPSRPSPAAVSPPPTKSGSPVAAQNSGWKDGITTVAMSEQATKLKQAFLDGPPEIDPGEVELDCLIGRGAFASVYKARCRGLLVAVKVPTKQQFSDHEMRAFRREVTIMRKVSHPNVMQLLGVSLQPGRMMIVTELMKGDIDKVVRSQRLSLLQKLRMIYDAAMGMNWLHGICHILHRDLKPENLLCDEGLHVKIADFGLSEILQGKKKDRAGPKGTALFAAPEILRQEEFDSSSDVYSFGIILYQIATGKEPFEEYTEIEPFVEAVCRRHERPHVQVTQECPKFLVDLMSRCWSPAPADRPTFAQIVSTVENFIIDTVVPEESPAKTFWKQHFLNPLREQVPWSAMEDIAVKSLTVIPAQLVKTKEILCSGPTPEFFTTVTLERFQQFAVWFGNWFEPAGKYVVREVNAIASSPWFHGEISSDEAIARLQNRADGTFLVRLSTSVRQCPFTISVINTAESPQPLHFRVHRITYAPEGLDTSPNGRYAVELANSQGWKPSSTLGELIETLRTAGVLRDACPKTKLAAEYISFPGTRM